MAEKSILFEDNMETQAADFNNMQGFIGTSIDHLVNDAIESGNAYTGLTVSQAAATQVTVGTGRLYWGNQDGTTFIYTLDNPVTIDFQTIAGAMPVTQQRQIAIVAWGSTIQTNVQPRNFVVDADTGQAQPESVAMEQDRVCNIGSINGVEAPAPSYPPVPATNLLIAYVLLSPSGVVSIQQYTATQLPNVSDQDARISALEAEWTTAEGQISTLQTALSALAAQLANYAKLDAFNKLVDLVNWCVQQIQRLSLPTAATYVLNTIDNFYDVSQSAVGTNVDGAYNAIVNEGLRFPGGATGSTTLQLLNPTEPTIQAFDTFILPMPSGMRLRMDCSFPDFDFDDHPLLNHPFWTFSPIKLNMARWRFRCGNLYTPVNASLQGQSVVDPISTNLMFSSESWTAVPVSAISAHPSPNAMWPRLVPDRWTYFWRDHCDVDYWNKVYTNLSYSANTMTQTFLNSQDGWLGGITLFSTQASFFQPLTITITECDARGKPDHNRCRHRIDLTATTIQPCYGQPIHAGDVIGTQIVKVGADRTTTVYVKIPTYIYPVRINFTPVFLRGGQRFAIHVVSTYAHRFSCSVDARCYSVHQGDFWEYDGVSDLRVVGGGPRTLRMQLWYLTWGQWQGQANQQPGQLRYPVNLQPLSLAGGIAAMDVLAEHIVPPATDLSYAVQVGGTWYPFRSDPASPVLTSNPALVPFEVIFTGTTDLMPAVSLTNSQVLLYGPQATGFYHISTSIPITSTTTGIKVLVTLQGWVSAHHTFSGALHYGSTHKLADVTASAALPDGGTQFTFTFNSTGVTAYQVELTGGTDGTGNPFVGQQRASFSA